MNDDRVAPNRFRTGIPMAAARTLSCRFEIGEGGFIVAVRRKAATDSTELRITHRLIGKNWTGNSRVWLPVA